MKRMFGILGILFLLFLSTSAFALSDSEYLKLKKSNSDFAKADKRLTGVYNYLRKSMSKSAFEDFKRDQRAWISQGRDYEAQKYIKEGYSRAEAYTMATNDRADELPGIAKRIKSQAQRPSQKPASKPKPKPKTEPEYEQEPKYNEYDKDENENENDENYEDEEIDDNISGKYIRNRYPEYKNDPSGDGQLTVKILDASSMEVEVEFSVVAPGAFWRAKGWLEDGVLELTDEQYRKCQATLTFEGNTVNVVTSQTEDWAGAMGKYNELDGTYIRKK